MGEYLEIVQQWSNTILLWIGFGTVVGLFAKAFMPGRDQGGTLATLFMGIGGSIVGLGTLAYFWEGHRVTPVSLIGFVAAIAGSFVLLLFHRMMQGQFFREGGTGAGTPAPKSTRRKAAVTVSTE